mmetsp:Transcript_1435/g.3852  ORF Transcript_1435/g.3852 Transcript_1435/m.3852 type:complete len:94 (-) Transcript_1435:379-660(-)
MKGGGDKARDQSPLVVHYRNNHKVLLALIDPTMREQVDKFREGKLEFTTNWFMSDDIFEDRLGMQASTSLLESVFGNISRSAMLQTMLSQGEY